MVGGKRNRRWRRRRKPIGGKTGTQSEIGLGLTHSPSLSLSLSLSLHLWLAPLRTYRANEIPGKEGRKGVQITSKGRGMSRKRREPRASRSPKYIGRGKQNLWKRNTLSRHQVGHTLRASLPRLPHAYLPQRVNPKNSTCIHSAVLYINKLLGTHLLMQHFEVRIPCEFYYSRFKNNFSPKRLNFFLF